MDGVSITSNRAANGIPFLGRWGLDLKLFCWELGFQVIDYVFWTCCQVLFVIDLNNNLVLSLQTFSKRSLHFYNRWWIFQRRLPYILIWFSFLSDFLDLVTAECDLTLYWRYVRGSILFYYPLFLVFCHLAILLNILLIFLIFLHLIVWRIKWAIANSFI